MTIRSLTLSPDCFASKSAGRTIPIQIVTEAEAKAWLKKASAPVRNRAKASGFTGAAGQVLILHDAAGLTEWIMFGCLRPLNVFSLSPLAQTLAAHEGGVFTLDGVGGDDIDVACIGWGLALYRFDRYRKKETKPSALPKLLWPKGVNKKAVQAQIDAACLIRTIINIPANDMGPDELEGAARTLAGAEGMSVKIIRGDDLLKRNFPMIHAVGRASPRAPRLIDLQWGDPKHPKLTLVGKGVCFDTGGLNLKPGTAMYTMKKDLGGAAHVLGLALLVIRYGLPVRLRVLIPAVENAVAGNAYRPSDVLTSRKGISVEVGDTDAEGRLVLADALAWADEEKPDLIVDFATLTGGVALGPDIPALFSNNRKLAFEALDVADAAGDPVWPLPLPQSYRKHMASDIADLCSVGNARGGTIHAALFLESFVSAKTDWLHLDLFGWEPGGRPGRSKGGTEMGVRAIFSLLHKRYARQPGKRKV